MKDVYSKYWINARKEIYGFLDYDKNLCKFIENNTPKGSTILEVAVGTGEPFANYFVTNGYNVHGIDISPSLIEECKTTNNNIDCIVGDAEALPYDDNTFECTYCFHSTWYFPNLTKAIEEMIRVTKKDGLIIFDIQNINNKNIYNAHIKRQDGNKGLKNKFKRLIKNVKTMIIKKEIPCFQYIIFETPTSPENIYSNLNKNRTINEFFIMSREEDSTIKKQNTLEKFEQFDRLLICIKK
jgi:ubiquinone/menaquinone biosynthesis C-methylase UbiE